MKALTRTQRLKILLQNGYFPRELPPPFVTRDFARLRKSISSSWPTTSDPNTLPSIVSHPRLGYKRRRLSIMNPISQFKLSDLISENWNEIKMFLDSSSASLDKPFLKGGIERAIPKPDFSRIDLKKLEAASEFDHILYSDISRFYGTVYTHAVPWAMYGKRWSKLNMFTPSFKNSLGNELDVRVRKGMSNQTIGIPIGPDTSRIISEIVAIAVERRYEELSGENLDNVFRYVDDWFIGFNTATQSEEAISNLARACTEYELELNIEKTAIVDARNSASSIWPEELHRLSSFNSLGRAQARAIRHFFETAFLFSSENTADNVLEYALKVARSLKVSDENFTLFESYLLKAVRASKITLPIATQILVNYKKRNAPVNLDRVSKLVRDIIAQAVPHGHTSEVAWALFLARELNITLSSSVFEEITKSDNSVCSLISLDLRQRGLISGEIDTTFWSSLMSTDSLYNSNWLFAYEADVKGWLPAATYPSHVDGSKWFRVLKQKKVSFYDPKRTVPTFDDSRKLQMKRLERRDGFSKILFGYSLGAASF